MLHVVCSFTSSLEPLHLSLICSHVGAGLPPGPSGALGAAEGVSYLVVLGLICWSLYAKVRAAQLCRMRSWVHPAWLFGVVLCFWCCCGLQATLA